MAVVTQVLPRIEPITAEATATRREETRSRPKILPVVTELHARAYRPERTKGNLEGFVLVGVGTDTKAEIQKVVPGVALEDIETQRWVASKGEMAIVRPIPAVVDQALDGGQIIGIMPRQHCRTCGQTDHHLVISNKDETRRIYCLRLPCGAEHDAHCEGC